MDMIMDNRSESKPKDLANNTYTKQNVVQVQANCDVCGKSPAKHSEEQPQKVPTTNYQNNRNEILDKRKERKKTKKIENKRIREQKILEEKINKQRSDKIQIISSKVYQKYQNSNNNERKPIHTSNKFRSNNVSLLDFIIEKSKSKRPLKQINKISPTTIKLNKGKRREIIKKINTRFKKIILKNRKLKKQIPTTLVIDPIVTEAAVNFEKLNLDDEKPNPPKSLTIHSRKFRPYCDNLTSIELCSLTEKILRELFRFQKRAYEKNEIKARVHRRFVIGFKETKNQLDANKLKLIVIAPDCEACDLPGGIDETISQIKSKCNDKNIPYLFSLRRRHLGYVLYKKVAINCIGIISYDGVQDVFHQLIECLNNDRGDYLTTINNQQKIQNAEEND